MFEQICAQYTNKRVFLYYNKYQGAMEAYIGNNQNLNLLRIYLLRNAYQVHSSYDKQYLNSLAGNCIIIRRNKLKNQTNFGYSEQIKTNLIKKIYFVYLATLDDLITFLWTHLTSEKPLTAGLFIDCIEQYFGQRFNFQQNGRAISICINILHQLSQKVYNQKYKIKIVFSFCFNPFVFQRSDFMNFMQKNDITCWQITPKEILKNGHEFQSEATKNFLKIYAKQPSIKQQHQEQN